MTDEPLRIGIAGLGTVGCGLLSLLEQNRDIIETRARRRLEVVAISARNRDRARPIDISSYAWEDDPIALARHPDIDLVLELMGGSDGPALALTRACLEQGRALVTANKALLAHHGNELVALAEKHSAPLRFEAAIAGGIPVVSGIRTGLAGNRISAVYGVLNGTCNYILTKMEQEGLPFDVVLGEAQREGYAEADPSFDIDGVDAAHKLSLLAALCFDSFVDFANVATEGIREISSTDISYAQDLDHRIRLIGLARLEDGKLFQRVHPCLVPASHPLAHVHDTLNAVVVEGNHVGPVLLQGYGAGAKPTASAVISDVITIARGAGGAMLSSPAKNLRVLEDAPQADHIGRYYIRMMVADRSGVLAEVTSILGDEGVSVESLLQKGLSEDQKAHLVLTTHATRQDAIDRALTRFKMLDSMVGQPVMMHILD